MLNDIFKSIDEKVREETGEIIQERERALLALKNDYETELAKKQQLARELLRKKADQEVNEQQKKLELEARFSVQQAKRQIMEDVYQKALVKLSQLSDGELKKIIARLVKGLPNRFEGRARAGKRTAPLLKHLLADKKITVVDDLSEEGFLIITPGVEIDLCFSQLLNQNREKTDPVILATLFS